MKLKNSVTLPFKNTTRKEKTPCLFQLRKKSHRLVAFDYDDHDDDDDDDDEDCECVLVNCHKII